MYIAFMCIVHIAFISILPGVADQTVIVSAVENGQEAGLEI